MAGSSTGKVTRRDRLTELKKNEAEKVVRATGKVTRLYVQPDETVIRLGDTNDVLPLNGYFHLKMSQHKNYNALYSLALAAAVNRYSLQIRVRGEIDPTQEANVNYMVIDW